MRAGWSNAATTDLIVAGSTGEGQTLDATERVALLRAVKEAVGDDAVVIANAGTNADARIGSRGAKPATAAGADAILAVVPYYNKPTQSGMLAHFGAIARSDAASGRRLQHSRAHRRRTCCPETLLELARRHPNDRRRQRVERRSQADRRRSCAIARRASSSGPATIISFCRALRWAPTAWSALRRTSARASIARCSTRIAAGDVDEAARIHASLLPLIDALFATTSPIPVKWAMGQLGFRVGACRLPLDEIPPRVAERLRPLLGAVRRARYRRRGELARNSRLPARSASTPTRRPSAFSRSRATDAARRS